MVRRRRALVWGASIGLLLALIGLVVVPAVITRSLSPQYVGRRASDVLGREVRIRELGLHFAPMPRVRLEGVWVAPDIELDVLDVGLSLVALLQLRLEVARLELEGVHLAVVRRVDGSFGLGGAAPSEPSRTEGVSLPAKLPEISLRSSRVDVLDHTFGEQPLSTTFLVDHLELGHALLGGDDSLHGRLRLGAAGERGSLRVDGSIRPPAEGDLLEGSARFSLEAEQLDPAVVLPYLPKSWDVRRVNGVVSGRVDAQLTSLASPRTGSEIDLELQLPGGVHEIGELSFGDGTQASMHLSWHEGGVEIREGRLESAWAALGDQRGSALAVTFGYAQGRLEVESLHLDALSASLGSEGSGSWALHVERTGSIALAAEPGKPGLLFGLSSAKARDARVTLSGPGDARVHILVDEFSVRDVALGQRASGVLAARLGDGEQGSLSVRSKTRILTRQPELASIHTSLEIRGEAIDLALLQPFLPPEWKVASRGARLDGVLRLARAPGPGFSGEIDLELATGALGVGPFDLEAPARLDGRGGRDGDDLRLDAALELGDAGSLQVVGLQLGGPATASGLLSSSDGALSFRDGRVVAPRASLGPYRASALDAKIVFENAMLSADSLTFEAYGGSWTSRGHLTLGEVPSFEIAVGVQAVHLDDLVNAGREQQAARQPVLLTGEARVSGRWTGEAQWLEPMEGEGRLELHDGFMPSQKLLRAIGLAIVGRVPGVSRLASDGSQSVSRTPLEHARIPFRIANGKFHSDDLDLATGDYHVRGQASLSPALQAHLGGEVVLTAQGVSKALTFGALPDNLRSALRLPAIPFEASGPLDDLRFRADVGRIPMATLRGLLGLPSRATDAVRGVGGAVMNAPGRVLNLRRRRPDSGTEAVPDPGISTPDLSDPPGGSAE